MSYRYGVVEGNRPRLDHSYRPVRSRDSWDKSLAHNYELYGQPPDLEPPDFLENRFRTAFPLTLSLKAYHKLCWRVRRFQLVGDITVDTGTGHFESEVGMVKLPVEGDAETDGMFDTVEAESELDIIRAAKRYFAREVNAPVSPPIDPPPETTDDVPIEDRDIFSSALRNTGFFMRTPDPVVPGRPFILGQDFDDDVNAGFSLLSDCYPTTGEFVKLLSFVGVVYDPEIDKVYVPLFFAATLIADAGSESVQAARDFVPETTAGYPDLYFAGAGPVNIAAGSLSIVGLEDDPVVIPLFRRGGTASATVTLTASEFWPWNSSTGDPIFDTATGEQLLGQFA